MTIGQINEVVLSSLRAHAGDIGDCAFKTVGAPMEREPDFWRVIVRPDRPIRRMGALDDVLNDIEEEIEKEHGLNVMIVAINPEETEASASKGA
jgi:hypothetical protein